MANILKHYGVLGMRWGVRRDRRSNHPDYEQSQALRKKPLHSLSDDEVRTLNKRLGIEAEYRKIPIHRKVGLHRAPASTRKMSTEEIQKLVQRINMETRYKDLKSKENKPANKRGAAIAMAIVLGLGSYYANREAPKWFRSLG